METFSVKTVDGNLADVNGNIALDNFDSKKIKFSKYGTNVRDDGQLPHNKILSTDGEGFLKLYSMALSPAPFLDELIPDSYLPNNTGNFIFKGAFFTPNMTVVIEGQTINYITFRSDNEILVNATTGSVEGNFSVTLNNGLEAIFPNALMIVLGEVFSPIESDWIITSSVSPDISEKSTIKVVSENTIQSAKWKKLINANIDFRLQVTNFQSPLSNDFYDLLGGGSDNIILLNPVDNSLIWKANFRKLPTEYYNQVRVSNTLGGDSGDPQPNTPAQGNPNGKTLTLERKTQVWKFFVDGFLIKTFDQVYNDVLEIRINILNQDFKNIKLIELAT